MSVLTRIVVSRRMPESNAFRSNAINQLYAFFAVCSNRTCCMSSFLVNRLLVCIALCHFFAISTATTKIQASATIE